MANHKYVIPQLSLQAKILRLECIEEAAGFVALIRFDCKQKRSKVDGVYNTWEEAHAALTRIAERELNSAQLYLQHIQDIADDVRALQRPHAQSDGGHESGTMWTRCPCRPAAQKVLAAAEGEVGDEAMINEHPIAPLPELVEEWIAEIWHEGTPVRVSASDIHVATQAARWGADQELEECVNYVDNNMSGNKARRLRAIRRPKPPGLKEQVKAELNRLIALVSTKGALSMAEPIRCALEQLDALP